MSTINFLVVLLLLAIAATNELPDYYKKCSRSDEKFETCLKENFKSGLKHLQEKGNTKLKLGGLRPINIEKIDLQASPQLTVSLHKAKFYGIEDQEIRNFKFTDDEIKIESHVAQFYMISEYDLNGKVLILPIQGAGNCNISLSELDFSYTAKLKTIEKDGQQMFSIEDDNMVLNVKRAYYQFDNLFNGDKRLGEEMNKFLNDNWKETFEEVNDAFVQITKYIFNLYITAHLNNVAKKDLFE